MAIPGLVPTFARVELTALGIAIRETDSEANRPLKVNE